MPAGTHHRHEDFPWTIVVVDHPPRGDSAAFRRSRKLMNKLAATTPDWVYGPPPYQDHHGGGIWVKDGEGWMCLQLPLGIEWSAQFCADPAKVDALRCYAARVVAAFPGTLEGYEALGYRDGRRLLETPITDAKGVAEWTDSIFNASVPMPSGPHTGVLPKGAGYHHYPKPIVDIDHFRHDSFNLFVTDREGLAAVVVPMSEPGADDGRVRLLGVHPRSVYAERLETRRVRRGRAGPGEEPAGPVLDPDDPLARAAFERQG